MKKMLCGLGVKNKSLVLVELRITQQCHGELPLSSQNALTQFMHTSYLHGAEYLLKLNHLPCSWGLQLWLARMSSWSQSPQLSSLLGWWLGFGCGLHWANHSWSPQELQQWKDTQNLWLYRGAEQYNPEGKGTGKTFVNGKWGQGSVDKCSQFSISSLTGYSGMQWVHVEPLWRGPQWPSN